MFANPKIAGWVDDECRILPCESTPVELDMREARDIDHARLDNNPGRYGKSGFGGDLVQHLQIFLDHCRGQEQLLGMVDIGCTGIDSVI